MGTSHIDETATIGQDTVVQQGCVVGPGVKVGERCTLGCYVVIHENTVIGNDVRIDDHAVVGKTKLRSKRSAMTSSGKQPPARIGSGVQIGTSTVVYAGCQIGDDVLIADLATVRENVKIGDGTIVGRGVAVENDCTIGSNCKLETNVYIAAKTTIGEYVFVAPGVLTSNDNYLGRTQERFKQFGGPVLEEACRIGVGAVILPGRTVHSEAVIAAGAIVTRDAQPATVHKGIPAVPSGPVPDDQLLEKKSENDEK